MSINTTTLHNNINKNFTIIITSIIVSVIFISFGTIFPLLPFIDGKFDTGGANVPMILAFFATGMAIGSFFFGLLSDKIGRKKSLLFATFLLSISYFITAIDHDYYLFLLLRFMSGFLSGIFSIAFAIASDISSKHDRLKTIGLVAASIAIGFVIGPIFGGILSKTNNGSLDFTSPFYLTTALTVIVFFLILFFFKETLREDLRTKHNIFSRKTFIYIVHFYQSKLFLMLTILNIGFVSMISGFQFIIGLWLATKFAKNPQEIGFFWSYYAIISVIVQGWLVRKLDSNTAFKVGFITIAIFASISVFINDYMTYIFFATFLSFSIALISPNIGTKISISGGNKRFGMIFGLSNGVATVGRVLGPVAVGFLYSINVYLMWYSIAVYSILLLSLILLINK